MPGIVEQNADKRVGKDRHDRERQQGRYGDGNSTQQKGFNPMKAINRINGWGDGFMVNKMNSFHKKPSMHDSMYYKKVDLIPQRQERQSYQYI
ncbi:hypothetical protein GCM10028791_22820 [Echinicola sediminis]